MREKILSLFSGKKINTVPAFSGLIHITVEGLELEGMSLHEIHHDAAKMARAAESTFKLTGVPSAALPLDLCAPAEALGAPLDFYENGEMQFPQVKQFLFESTKDIGIKNQDILDLGRMRIISDAIHKVKDDIGSNVVLSGLIPGPYTLLLYLCNPTKLFIEMKKDPQTVLDALFRLSEFLADIGQIYHATGADFITIHDMGGSAGFIGPARYEQFVYPPEKDLIEKLSMPCVLSVCGNMEKVLPLLAQTGANAISVDQLTDLTLAREAFKDNLLFGNIDPVETLSRGDDAHITETVARAKEAGVDAVWPGCDLVPFTPGRAIRAML